MTKEQHGVNPTDKIQKRAAIAAYSHTLKLGVTVYIQTPAEERSGFEVRSTAIRVWVAITHLHQITKTLPFLLFVHRGNTAIGREVNLEAGAALVAPTGAGFSCTRSPGECGCTIQLEPIIWVAQITSRSISTPFSNVPASLPLIIVAGSLTSCCVEYVSTEADVFNILCCSA